MSKWAVTERDDHPDICCDSVIAEIINGDRVKAKSIKVTNRRLEREKSVDMPTRPAGAIVVANRHCNAGSSTANR
jgi:hypothetical protein